MNRRHSLTRAISIAVMMLLLVTAVSGCEGWLKKLLGLGGDIDFVERELMNTEDILNRAIIDISANSENWQRIIQKALDDLPQTQRQVRQDLEELMQRGIHNAGLEVRCNISYLGDMLIQGLNRILAKLRGQTPPPLQAFICDASPAAIDMNLDPNRRNNVEVYGYNLDESNLRLYHVMRSGQRDETDDFSLVSAFKRVINLGSNGIILNQQSQRLRMDLGGGVSRDIPVIQAYPDICEMDDTELTTQSIKVIPTKVGGDKEFAGHGPCISATAMVYTAANQTQLRGRIDVDIWECPDKMERINGDKSEAIGTEDRVLYTTDHDWKIAEIRSPTTARLQFIDTDEQPNAKPDTGLVALWNIVGDTGGDDIGESYVQVTFNMIKLSLRKAKDCVTEEELARMMQQGALSNRVQDHLRTSRPMVIEKANIPIPAKPRRTL